MEGVGIISWWWPALVAGALVAGASFVGLLVAPNRAEAIIAATGLFAFGLSVYSLVGIAGTYERLDAMLYGLAFMSGGIGGGWALAASLLDRLPSRPGEVDPPEDPPAGRPRPAVIVTLCIEPERYGARSTAHALQVLTDEGLLESSIGVLPFLFFAQKARYRAVGGTSPAASQLVAVTEAVAVRLADHHIDWVEWAVCGGGHRLSCKVAEAVSAGYDEVVVVHMGLADSLQMAAAERELDSLHLEELGVRIIHTDPLGTTDGVVASLVERITRSTADPVTAGVVLLGHGQPSSRSHLDPAFDESEASFLNRVRMALVESGISEAHARIAWTEWRQPDVTSSVRHLAALGCRRILVVPAAYPLDTLVTRLDVELAVKQARVEEATDVITLPAWRDDPIIIEELAQRALGASEKMRSSQAAEDSSDPR